MATALQPFTSFPVSASVQELPPVTHPEFSPLLKTKFLKTQRRKATAISQKQMP